MATVRSLEIEDMIFLQNEINTNFFKLFPRLAKTGIHILVDFKKQDSLSNISLFLVKEKPSLKKEHNPLWVCRGRNTISFEVQLIDYYNCGMLLAQKIFSANLESITIHNSEWVKEPIFSTEKEYKNYKLFEWVCIKYIFSFCFPISSINIISFQNTTLDKLFIETFKASKLGEYTNPNHPTEKSRNIWEINISDFNYEKELLELEEALKKAMPVKKTVKKTPANFIKGDSKVRIKSLEKLHSK